VYPQTSKGKTGFQGGHSCKPYWGYGSGRLNNSGLGKYKKRSHQGAAPTEAKEMTGTYKQCINTMYKKFDQTCELYPSINTTDFNDTPHKAVDRPDGLAYKQFKSGRETGLLPAKLGTHNARPMGLKCNNRVQIRAYPNATPSKAHRDFMLTGRACKISLEIKELQAKGIIIEAPPTQSSFVSQIFLVEKKGGDRGQ